MDSQTFCLRWDSFQTSVTSLFDSLRQNDELVDITLCCEGQKVQAHRMMLSACSPYFRELFKNNRCQEMLVFLKDTSADDLRAVVEFMYKGSVNVAQNQLASFIKTAEMLQVQGLSGGEDRDGPEDASPPSRPVSPQQTRRRIPTEHDRWPPPERPVPPPPPLQQGRTIWNQQRREESSCAVSPPDVSNVSPRRKRPRVESEPLSLLNTARDRNHQMSAVAPDTVKVERPDELDLTEGTGQEDGDLAMALDQVSEYEDVPEEEQGIDPLVSSAPGTSEQQQDTDDNFYQVNCIPIYNFNSTSPENPTSRDPSICIEEYHLKAEDFGLEEHYDEEDYTDVASDYTDGLRDYGVTGELRWRGGGYTNHLNHHDDDSSSSDDEPERRVTRSLRVSLSRQTVSPPPPAAPPPVRVPAPDRGRGRGRGRPRGHGGRGHGLALPPRESVPTNWRGGRGRGLALPLRELVPTARMHPTTAAQSTPRGRGRGGWRGRGRGRGKRGGRGGRIVEVQPAIDPREGTRIADFIKGPPFHCPLCTSKSISLKGLGLHTTYKHKRTLAVILGLRSPTSKRGWLPKPKPGAVAVVARPKRGPAAVPVTLPQPQENPSEVTPQPQEKPSEETPQPQDNPSVWTPQESGTDPREGTRIADFIKGPPFHCPLCTSTSISLKGLGVHATYKHKRTLAVILGLRSPTSKRGWAAKAAVVPNPTPGAAAAAVVARPRRGPAAVPVALPQPQENPSEVTPQPHERPSEVTPLLQENPSEVVQNPQEYPSEVVQNPQKSSSQVTLQPQANPSELVQNPQDNYSQVTPQLQENPSELVQNPQDNSSQVTPQLQENPSELVQNPQDNYSEVTLQPQENPSELVQNPQDNSSEVTLQPQANPSEVVQNPQENSSEVTPHPRANSSEGTPQENGTVPLETQSSGRRSRYAQWQVNILKKELQKGMYPNRERIGEIAEIVQLDPSKVYVWFCNNRRGKTKGRWRWAKSAAHHRGME